MRRTLVYTLGGLMALTAVACGPSKPTVTLAKPDGSEVSVKVEIARTGEELRRGLMFRTEMAQDHGMLFVFAGDGPRSFWMKNTPLPLDIIYIGGNGRVVSIAESTTPYSEESLPSKGPATYVLEVNAGFSRQHGIGPGTKVTLPKLSPNG